MRIGDLDRLSNTFKTLQIHMFFQKKYILKSFGIKLRKW